MTTPFLLFVLLVCFPSNGFAYLDPGTGSYVLQILAAALFTGVFVLKTWWRKIIGFFKKKNDGEVGDE